MEERRPWYAALVNAALYESVTCDSGPDLLVELLGLKPGTARKLCRFSSQCAETHAEKYPDPDDVNKRASQSDSREPRRLPP